MADRMPRIPALAVKYTLPAAKLDETVRDAVLAQWAAYVHDDKIVSIDP